MVTIKPGTCRDLCFVAANMRDQDRREIGASAKLESMTAAAMLSWQTSGPGWCWTAWLDGQPHAAFGLSAVGDLQPHMLAAWAWGTERFRRCVPAISRFCLTAWPDQIISHGYRRVEVRSLKDHDLAHKWLAGLRARKEAEMPGYGVNGETFELWSWIKDDWI